MRSFSLGNQTLAETSYATVRYQYTQHPQAIDGDPPCFVLRKSWIARYWFNNLSAVTQQFCGVSIPRDSET